MLKGPGITLASSVEIRSIKQSVPCPGRSVALRYYVTRTFEGKHSRSGKEDVHQSFMEFRILAQACAEVWG